ncbi:MAG TPA: hypothetical protein VFW40_02545 [Capsulimonadaceae bacterium]|nr:hypothetical protein [Capsulimonadaceae bacterium]
MKVGRQIAKFAAGCAFFALAALPALAQSTVTVTRHQNLYNGNVVVHRTVTSPYGATTSVTRRHHRYHRYHRYNRRYHSTTLYMTPYGTSRTYYHERTDYR